MRINVRSGSDSVRWNDGATSAFKRITNAGTYWVKSFSGCSVITDSFSIKAKNYTVRDNIFDTTLCAGESLKITGPGLFHTFLWSGGNTSKDTTLFIPGVVNLIATDTIKCETERIEYNLSFISLNSSLSDTFICNNDPVFVDAKIDNQSAKYLWHNGERSSGIFINTPGMNDVKISVGNCFIRDSFQVSQILIDANIGKDTLVCAGERLTLKANEDNASYKWSTGETGREISVFSPGEYVLRVSHGVCTVSDSILVDFVKCNECIAVPNAFTPNQDSRNDIFRPVVKCNFKTYAFDIFNRYGQKVFTSNNSTTGWDGNFNSQPCENGTYFYQIKVTTAQREEYYKGDVVLIR
jgi:gliding motility-associated-like protein